LNIVNKINRNKDKFLKNINKYIGYRLYYFSTKEGIISNVKKYFQSISTLNDIKPSKLRKWSEDNKLNKTFIFDLFYTIIENYFFEKTCKLSIEFILEKGYLILNINNQKDKKVPNLLSQSISIKRIYNLIKHYPQVVYSVTQHEIIKILKYLFRNQEKAKKVIIINYNHEEIKKDLNEHIISKKIVIKPKDLEKIIYDEFSKSTTVKLTNIIKEAKTHKDLYNDDFTIKISKLFTDTYKQKMKRCKYRIEHNIINIDFNNEIETIITKLGEKIEFKKDQLTF
jgi:hypothetical protein